MLGDQLEFAQLCPTLPNLVTQQKGRSMELRYVLVQQEEGICRITLNRPERLGHQPSLAWLPTVLLVARSGISLYQ